MRHPDNSGHVFWLAPQCTTQTIKPNLLGREMRSRSEELVAAIGRSMVAWAHVENCLTHIFRNIGFAEPEHADKKLSQEHSFRARLRLIDDKLKEHLPKELKPDWAILCESISTLAKKRNQVAHSTLLNIDGKEPGLKPFWLVSISNPTLYIDDLRSFIEEFRDMGTSLVWFQDEICAQIEGKPSYSYPPKHMLALRQQALSKTEEDTVE
ncbi:MAG: hypothetical protein AAF527_09225 [Pseudomonadota bacterium]